MQMRLPVLLRVFDPLLKNVLCLLYKLSVEIDRIISDSSLRVVLAENIVGRLLVVLVHLRGMRLAFLRQLMRRCSITSFVCPMCLFGSVRPVLEKTLIAVLGRGRVVDFVPCRNKTRVFRLLVAQDRANDHIQPQHRSLYHD
jgi:hypothetical protein